MSGFRSRPVLQVRRRPGYDSGPRSLIFLCPSAIAGSLSINSGTVLKPSPFTRGPIRSTTTRKLGGEPLSESLQGVR
ncbi:MAG: hypothetical protein MZV64_71515 [Ignavibacteriales bacterium]|nr:hypothetical protein [Ignavibacteriales bacterium]